MTNTVAALRRTRAARSAAVLALCAASIVLGGCETSNGLFNQSGQAVQPLALATPTPAAKRARIAIAPVIGPTQAVASDIAAQMSQQLERERIAVVAGDQVDYTLRGYVVATKEKARTKFSYIWDVMDPAGKRVNRFTGEEVGAAVTAGDAWTAATPQVLQSVALRASTSLVAWLPPTAPSTGDPAAAASAGAAASSGAAVARAQPASATTTASLPSTKSVVVARVVGAPGDGSQSLADALGRELGRSGLAVGPSTAASTHKVEGTVIVGKTAKVTADKGGGELQPIQIQWTVKDARGQSIGTVSQKNDIKPGELDGAWGPNADAVAAAAAQGIIKLIDKQTAVN